MINNNIMAEAALLLTIGGICYGLGLLKGHSIGKKQGAALEQTRIKALIWREIDSVGLKKGLIGDIEDPHYNSKNGGKKHGKV